MRKNKNLVALKTFVATAILLGGLASLPVAAQDAFSVPISETLIEGVLLLPDGTQATFMVREGEFFTVRNADSMYGFLPKLVDSGSQQVELLTFQIQDLPQGGQSVEQRGKPIRLALNQRVLVPPASTKVEFLRILPQPHDTEEP